MTLMTPERFLDIMKKTPGVLDAVLRDVTQEQAENITDGADGWSILEIVCHLRDYEAIFLERSQVFVDEDNGALPPYDHLALVVERRYKEQNMRDALAKFHEGRKVLLEWYGARAESDWKRTGTHKAFGQITLLDHAMHIGWHDLNHIEQIVHSMVAG